MERLGPELSGMGTRSRPHFSPESSRKQRVGAGVFGGLTGLSNVGRGKG